MCGGPVTPQLDRDPVAAVGHVHTSSPPILFTQASWLSLSLIMYHFRSGTVMMPYLLPMWPLPWRALAGPTLIMWPSKWAMPSLVTMTALMVVAR